MNQHSLSASGRKETSASICPPQAAKRVALRPEEDIASKLYKEPAWSPRSKASSLRTFHNVQHLPNCYELIDKGKSSESWGRKATGLRFLRHALLDATKDPKIAGLPVRRGCMSWTGSSCQHYWYPRCQSADTHHHDSVA